MRYLVRVLGGFSIFGIASASSLALPVELAEFRLQNVDNDYFRLVWVTLSESNNYGFEIERSLGRAGFQTHWFCSGHRQFQ